jgi:SAM-dependent methyltransferase
MIAMHTPTEEANRTVERNIAQTQGRLLGRFMAEAPFQPATNLWRAVELPALASVLPTTGMGLDVGCGDGVLTGILRDLVGADWTLVGIDPNPAETALATASGLYQRVHAVGADTIPETDETFDFVFANSVLEHIPNLPACLRDMARCLKPGGLLAATVPSPHFHDCLRGPGWSRRQTRAAYLDETDARLAHVQYWSEERWREELQEVGLEPQPTTWYLSQKQVRRWEFWSNWTGGLLYRWRGRTQQPIEIQRGLGLRRGLPRPLRFLGPSLARLVSLGVRGDFEPNCEANGCFLVMARKAVRGEGGW